jgi:phosphoglycolate phosphatase
MRHFVPEALVADAVKVHVSYTNTILLDDAKLMPGTLELLRDQQPKGVKFAVFTNKRGDHARLLCEHLGVTPFLSGIFGAKDTPWLKPQPEFAAFALGKLGARPESAMLIGDSPFDVKAAHAGGFACWGVTTGTHTAEQLRAAGAEAVFPDLFQLRDALNGD